MFETLTPATTKTDAAAKRVASVIEQLFPEPRTFGVRLWDGTLLHAQDKPAFTLVLNTPGALRHMFTPPIELSLGEAFIHGDFDIEDDIFAAFSIFESLSALSLSAGEWAAITRDLLTLPKSPARPANRQASVRKNGHARGRAQLSGAKHSRERDQAAVLYHYDVGTTSTLCGWMRPCSIRAPTSPPARNRWMRRSGTRWNTSSASCG
jgi:cyclopropane-fatty-acyl-phospholipid synthase